VKIVEFKGAGASAEEAIEVLDQLRSDLESGKVMCFCAVGISKDDATTMWLANVGRSKTNLQLMGALANLMLHFWKGDIQ
jgi:hypothetical protein